MSSSGSDSQNNENRYSEDINEEINWDEVMSDKEVGEGAEETQNPEDQGDRVTEVIEGEQQETEGGEEEKEVLQSPEMVQREEDAEETALNVEPQAEEGPETSDTWPSDISNVLKTAMPPTSATEILLKRLKEDFGIPSNFSVEMPKESDYLGKKGDRIVVCRSFFEHGLRVPLPSLYREVLEHYEVGLSQLTPNSWRAMCSFLLLCKEEGVTATLGLFREFYQLKFSSQGNGWYTLSARGGVPPIMTQANTSLKKWKDHWFIMSAKQLGVKNVMQLSKNIQDSVKENDVDEADVQKLRESENIVNGHFGKVRCG